MTRIEQKETILEQKETKVTKGESPAKGPDKVRQSQNRPDNGGLMSRLGPITETAEALPVLEFFVSFVTFCSNVLLISFCPRTFVPELPL